MTTITTDIQILTAIKRVERAGYLNDELSSALWDALEFKLQKNEGDILKVERAFQQIIDDLERRGVMV